MMAAQRLLLNLRFLFRVYLLALLVFFIYRFAYLFRILSGEMSGLTGDILKAFITGLRFDTATICYGMTLPVLLSFICLAGEKAKRITFRVQRIYLVILFVVFVMVLTVDYYYYTYFQSHINVQIFGFMEDDTAAVIKSLWTDYPLLTVLTGLVVSAILFNRLIKLIGKKLSASIQVLSAKRSILFSFLMLLLFVAGLRSSFGTFPVQMDDASISENAKVNLLPINGVFALKDAIVYHNNEFNLDHVMQYVSGLGYNDKQAAMKDYFGEENIKTGIDPMYRYTDTNYVVRQSPPNIVFFLLESWSNNNMYLQSKEINLLGSLEKYWNSDILFRHFLSGHNGTINSIEGMMINTPVTPVAQSEYSDVTFETSCAKPFYEKGYTTTFISGGKINWRNINNFIPKQYFQYVEGNADIASSIPGTKECEWGAYDEYLFDDVFKKLGEAKSNPQFIFALSTTNHTPFHIPDHYKPYPIKLSQEITGKLKVSEDIVVKNLTNLQYTNDCLGKFLEQLDASPYAENTIVIATGDHNNLMLFDFDEAHAFYRYSVPMMMHVPVKYLYKSAVDTTLWGSHKDIFPTIYNLSLDSVAYFDNGNNLLEKNPDRKNFFAINIMGDAAINDDGFIRFGRHQFFSRRGDLFQPVEEDAAGAALESLMKKSRAYYSMLAFQLKEEIEKHHSKSFLKK
jgi:phosphoglycerol transferase MdoB-like AlkP superfamily enzyme